MIIRRAMHFLARLSAPVAFAMLLGPAPAAAEEEARLVQAEQTSAYEDLYAAMREGVDDTVMIENILDTMIAEIRRQAPEFALLEEEEPQLMNNLRGNVRPVLMDYSERVRLAYLPEMIAVLQGGLTAAEARNLAAFYRSEVGQKLLAGVSGSFTGEETMRGMGGDFDQQVDTEAVARDIRSASVKAYLTLTPEERQEVESVFAQNPALAKMSALQPRINAVRAAMENEAMTPEEEARMDAALDDTFAPFSDDLPEE